MWHGIVIKHRGESVQEAAAQPGRWRCSFDGAIYGDREAKRMAKKVGRAYAFGGGAGQPRYVVSPMEPFGEEEWAEVESALSRGLVPPNDLPPAEVAASGIFAPPSQETAGSPRAAPAQDADPGTGLEAEAVELLRKTAVPAMTKERVVLEDDEGGRFGFRLHAHDWVAATTDELGLEPDCAYFGVELEISNLIPDDEAWTSITAILKDARGRVYEHSAAQRAPDFDPEPLLEPGQSARGYLLFEMPVDAQPDVFRLGLDGTDAAAEWALHSRNDRRESAPTAQIVGVDSPSDDPVDKIRRLARLWNEGIITAAEFEAKKTELLGRL